MGLAKFKRDFLSINETIYFDPKQFLREKTTHPSKMKQLIDDAEALLTNSEILAEDQYFLYGTLGNLYRIYGNPKLAIHYLSLNLALIDREDKTKEVITLIRLGEAFKYDHHHTNALANFNQAITMCNEFDCPYLDFALQHKGKCLLEMQKTEGAIACFQEAYRMRKEKGDAALLQSTKMALIFAQDQL